MSDKTTKRPALEIILEELEQMERYLAGEKQRHDKRNTGNPFLNYLVWAEFQTLVRVLMGMGIATTERQNATRRLRNLDQAYCFEGEGKREAFRRFVEELQQSGT